MTAKLYHVALDDHDRALLEQVAEHERREPRHQIVILLRVGLRDWLDRRASERAYEQRAVRNAGLADEEDGDD